MALRTATPKPESLHPKPEALKPEPVPMTSQGTLSLRLDFSMQSEQYPDDVETVILSPEEATKVDKGTADGVVGRTCGEEPALALEEVRSTTATGGHPIDDQ